MDPGHYRQAATGQAHAVTVQDPRRQSRRLSHLNGVTLVVKRSGVP